MAKRAPGLVSAALNTLFFAGYPFAIYFALTRHGARVAALVVLIGLGVSVGSRLRVVDRSALVAVLKLPATLVALVVTSAALDDARFILAMPVLINGALLLGFAATLRSGVPMVERFARLQHPDLTAAEERYCRTVTAVWCGFFACNGAVALALALFAPLEWWTLYTGVVAYVLIGVMFAVEFTVRKVRFRRFGAGLHDRVFRRLLGESPQEASRS